MPTPLANLLIQQARLIDPATQTDVVTDVLIEQGNIKRIGNLAASDHPNVTAIDAKGLWLIPGLVDIGAPAMAFDAVATESLAAASGGVTHLAVFPSLQTTLDNTAQLRLLQERAALTDCVRLLPIAALTRSLKGEQLTDMVSLSQAGAIAFSNAQHPVISNLTLKRCLEYASTFDLQITVCPQDHDLSMNACVHQGAVASRLGLAGIPDTAETLALSRALLLAEEAGIRLHVHHLSSAQSLPMIQQARQKGIKVTADVTIHHLLADETDTDRFDNQYYVMPPLRRTSDREALLSAVADGTLNGICSQHTPLSTTDKCQPFESSVPGIAGVETLLPLVLQLVNDGKLPLMRAIGLITHSPADCFNLKAGRIKEGSKANLCLLNASVTQKPADHWQSGGQNSPWRNSPLPGSVQLTVTEGHITWQQQA